MDRGVTHAFGTTVGTIVTVSRELRYVRVVDRNLEFASDP